MNVPPLDADHVETYFTAPDAVSPVKFTGADRDRFPDASEASVHAVRLPISEPTPFVGAAECNCTNLISAAIAAPPTPRAALLKGMMIS
jgi:hypothetical protein